MVSQPLQSQSRIEEELDPHVGGEDQETYDDRLASKLYEDYSSQHQVVLQVFLALAGAGVGYGVDVRDAYAFFAREKIDTEKLIKDPKYRAQIKRYAGHLNRWEKKDAEGGINKSNKLGAVLEGANKAIKEVDATNDKLVKLKEGLIDNYKTELQNLYGLSKDEIDAITQRAKYAVLADPNISMQDFVQREAQGYARERLEKEIKKEKLTPEQREDRINTQLSEIDKRFSQKTAEAGDFEKFNNHKLTYDCKQEIDQMIAHPPAAPQPFPSSRPTSPPPVVISPPPPPPTIPASAFPSIPGFSLPKFSLPNISRGGLGGGGGLSLGGAIGNGFKSMFGTGGILSKAGSGLASAAGSALPKLASLAAPPVAAALTTFTAIDALTGGMATKVIGMVIVVAVSLPIIMMLFLSSNTFSSYTAGNPAMLRASVKNDKTISWTEFEKQYLSINSERYLSLESLQKTK